MKNIYLFWVATAAVMSSCCPLPAAIQPVDWFLETGSIDSGLGISFTGIVDTDANTFTMETFSNDGPVTTYTPVVPIVLSAVAISGLPFDVPDDFGTAPGKGIGDDWLFLGPLHALTTYSEGPTSGDGYHLSWGGSEALSGFTVGQDERILNLAISGMASGTFMTDKLCVSIPESSGYVFAALGLMALVGLAMTQR